MKFPETVEHRHETAKIYGRSTAYPYYRLTYHAAGKRVVRSFSSYKKAKRAAKRAVRDLAKGNPSVALTAGEAADALAIRQALDAFRRDTGRSVTALQAVSQYLDNARKLGDRPLSEAVDTFLQTVITVQRKDLAEAVAEFVEGRRPLGESVDGKRSRLNPVYVRNVRNWLTEFAKTFPGSAVCDLSKDHLGAYIGAHADLSPKSRNDRRTTVRMFLRWCMRKDYLPAAHRLFEADGMAPEAAEPQGFEFYRPDELRTLLDGASEAMRPVIALQALAGLRLEECLRLEWREVFGIRGHIEISTAKSKTRQRRLVTICPALAQWLRPYRGMEGKVWSQTQTFSGYVQAFIALRQELKFPSKKNGLRHAFCTYHFALHANENLTAALAGNSPAIIHGHYKGLATKAEARAWFAVRPVKAAGNVVSSPHQASA